MKIWAFCTYKWQGNPKALFLYMTKYMAETHECWWVADNSHDAKIIKDFGFSQVTYIGSERAKKIFAATDVYVSENFREKYPAELNENAIIFNTWHGVGLKHIEIGINENSSIADAIVRKNIRNFNYYKNRTCFLVTSSSMKEHFIEDTLVEEDRMIEGGYPRNLVYSDASLSTFDFSDVAPRNIESYSRIGLFAPTWRSNKTRGLFQYLIPSINELEKKLSDKNDLLIIKVHPMMQDDPHYKEVRENFKSSSNILFWDDAYDIYEVFSKIDFAIIDYSSIFYDLLASGVERFIRYIPDYIDYTRDSELIGDFFNLTGGAIAEDFNNLLFILDNEIEVINNKSYLFEYFFEYSKNKSIKEIINEVENVELISKKYPELHSFDVFDTLIRRKTLAPFSIFSSVQRRAQESKLNFSSYFLDNWPKIRNQVEHDVRDMRRKTTYERASDSIEITYDAIFERLAQHMDLNQDQIDFLKNAEIQAELEHVEPISERISLLFEQIAKGNEVILISDMYLPENVIRQMLKNADERLAELPLYLSASIGHQKSTGKLYKHIFFKNKYRYQRWVHYGDNAHADGAVPRKLGIEAFVHQMDAFIPYEKLLIDGVSASLKYDAYRIATGMQRYRKQLLSSESSQVLEQKYYSYAYAGMALVPYVHWTILDALRRGYETLYFISRDGHFLKMIADSIIEKAGYEINTRFIYGSRKVWRVPSFIHEVDAETFGPFGNFVGMDSFEDLVRASLISEDELLALFPQFADLRDARHLRGEIAENVRKTLENSNEYKQKILEIAANQRELVRDYLRQQINFNERFAFVEFWGRGYTQDVFGRLLDDAAGHSVNNAFYYVRSFTEGKGTVVRHNFMLTPHNFSYFEPIFAATPYESITAYQRGESGDVHPVLVERPSQIAEIISEGLLDFVNDYIPVALENHDLIRTLASLTYDYQIKNKTDHFICSVYADLEDNISSYGVVKAVAPKLSVRQLEAIRDKKDLDVITKDISISLARSSDAVREYYRKNFKKMKWPNAVIEPVKKVYAINDLAMYVISDKLPFKAISVHANAVHFDISLSQESKRQDVRFKQYEVFDVIAIDWLTNGVPRLLTPYGYVTANKEYVQKVMDANVQTALTGLQLLIRGIERRSILKSGRVPAPPKPAVAVRSATHLVNAVGKMHGLDMKEVKRGKKWQKFTRNPYQFFEDSKKPSLRRLRIFFNPNHIVGRASTRWVRQFLN